MIGYDWMREEWCDTEDDTWAFEMTPESKEDCEHEFENREEFYRWLKEGGMIDAIPEES